MASKIIKSDGVPESLGDRNVPRPVSRPAVVGSEVYEAHQKAQQIRDAAEADAARIRESAKRERDEVLRAAREEGYQQGIAKATEIQVRAREERTALIAATEPELVRLALQIGEKLVGKALEIDREIVLEITAQAIESVRHQRELVVRVHPEDAELLRTHRKKLMDMLGRTKEIAVRDDPEVARGGCIIETEHGTVDAQLPTQLAILEEALFGAKKND